MSPSMLIWLSIVLNVIVVVVVVAVVVYIVKLLRDIRKEVALGHTRESPLRR